MSELLTAAQMRAIEGAAIESGQVTGLELMERAGRGVVEAVFKEWPDLAKTSHRAVVLCGPGNNGGDGFVVARLLKEWGWEVEVFLYGDPKKLPPDAKVNCKRWGEMGNIKAIDGFEADSASYDLGFDALFGTGLVRPLDRELCQKARELRMLDRVVAIDLPSGYCSDSGKALGEDEPKLRCFDADLVVSFHSGKPGHYLQDCASVSQKLKIVDIGIHRHAALRVFGEPSNHESRTQRYRKAITGLCTDRALRPGFSDKNSILDKGWDDNISHKYKHGHVLILSGGSGKTGAARLAARGALRIGAGLVTLGVPPSAQMEVASQVMAVMLKRVEGADGLAEVLEDGRLNALCLGPGLGAERARVLVPVAVRAKHTPYVVLDADALTAFSDDPSALFGVLTDKCVLTPHGGEFAQLFPDLADKLKATPVKGPAYSKVDATREAAKRAGCVVLFKGPDTVIAAPDGRASINSAQYERAAPWLATAGSGDVLAGFITGLLARGFDPMSAAETAAWLHVECALSFGPGLIAEDLPEELPKVFRTLGL